MQQQLPHVALGWRRYPDPRKPPFHQQLQQQQRIPPVGLLLSLATGADLRRVPDPQLMPQLREQPLEPLRLPTGLYPYTHRPLQRGIKRSHLLYLFVTQRFLAQFSCLLIQHRNLLIARVKITSYNLHCSAPSSRALVAHHAKSTRVLGADAVMKSTGASRRFFFPPRSCEAVDLRREESLFVCAFAFFTSMSATLRERESNIMKKKTEKRERRDELRREYDLSKLNGGVRGQYIARYPAGTNLGPLSPDVPEYFPDEQSVNTALRTLIPAGKRPLLPGHAPCGSRSENKSKTR